MNKKRVILLFAIGSIGLTTMAAPRTKAQMKEAAARAINEQRAAKRMAPKAASEMQTLKTAGGYEIIGLQQAGFAVVAKDDVAPEVLGVSMKPYNEQNTNFQWWLKAINEVVETAASNGTALAPVAPDPNKYPTQVGPLLTTEWDQLEPYNTYCPNSNGGDRCYTGCVATAMAQVLNYFKVPEHGTGSRTIYYHSTAVTANFGEHYYDWNNMRDQYLYNNWTDAEAEAVAVLMRDCGVAANMEYGGYQEGGSGAFSQDAAEGLRIYFGFEEAQCVERDNYYGTKYYTDAEWMDMVFTALSEDGPIYYGGADSWQGGHAFVLHGYRADGKVYVNWGWSGDDDGYYDISLLNPSGYQFSVGQDMILGVKGERRELHDKDVELTQAGTLSTQFEDGELGYVGALKVTGAINSSDLLYLRKLAGVDENGEKTDGFLNTLDLSGATIVEGGNPYLIDGSRRLTTTANELPERAFYGCKQLSTLKLPAGLTHIGDGAWAVTPKLSTLEIGTPAANADFTIDEQGLVWNAADQTDLITVLPTVSGELTLPKGTVSLHDYALAGRTSLSSVVLPSSVTTIGREAFRSASALTELRVGAKEVPTLTGADVFTGVSTTSCKLSVPSGMKTKYAQKAQWKEFVNVSEYGSTVKARNTIRKYGEENPALYYQVIGDPVEGEPVLACEATPESPAGRYPITIDYGTIVPDESIELADGYLVVQKVEATATVENATREQGQPNPEFTLSFEGLVNGETTPVWLKEPVFTVEADETSEPGEYPITVTAEAESYELTFVAGTLTITETTTGISNVNADQQQQKANTYDLSGRRVNNRSAKGVYIMQGKKVVR